jgi:hypothetical protein
MKLFYSRKTTGIIGIEHRTLVQHDVRLFELTRNCQKSHDIVFPTFPANISREREMADNLQHLLT